MKNLFQLSIYILQEISQYYPPSLTLYLYQCLSKFYSSASGVSHINNTYFYEGFIHHISSKYQMLTEEISHSMVANATVIVFFISQ